jgi:hypothetical protein
VHVALAAALSAASLFMLLAASTFTAPETATDWFNGTALIPAGQTSPVSVDPDTLTLRADGAVGLGYSCRASGQLPGAFTYEEHGFLFFRNPADPTTMVGSQFSSGVFRLVPARSERTIQIADTAPSKYSSACKQHLRSCLRRCRKSSAACRGGRAH